MTIRDSSYMWSVIATAPDGREYTHIWTHLNKQDPEKAARREFFRLTRRGGVLLENRKYALLRDRPNPPRSNASKVFRPIEVELWDAQYRRGHWKHDES